MTFCVARGCIIFDILMHFLSGLRVITTAFLLEVAVLVTLSAGLTLLKVP